MIDQPAVLLDVETTGGDPALHRIIEIGLIEVDGGRCIGEWSTLVNPGRSIPQGIQTLTGITEEMTRAAPAFADLAPGLYERLEGKVLVAHNARFDYGFLRHEFLRAGLRYASRVLCTVKLARRLFPHYPRHNLDSLIVRYRLSGADRHRALGDARTMWLLGERWRQEIDAALISDAVACQLEALELLPDLPREMLDAIPETRGVYTLHGENDAALYVGRAASLRGRVIAHLAGAGGNAGPKILQEVKHVSWVEATGELAAQIEEARLIRRHAPLFNRRRDSGELCSWRRRPEEPGPPQLAQAQEIEPDRLDDLFGLFRSRRAAVAALRSLAASHRLCLIELGLEQGPGPCSAQGLGACGGACEGKERGLAHAMRVGAALARLRLRRWPFRGPIAVRERNAEALVVLDRWCYLGTARSEDELFGLATEEHARRFDLDIYRILTRFLAHPRGSYRIIELTGARRLANHDS